MTDTAEQDSMLQKIKALEERLAEQESLWEKDRTAAEYHRRFLQFIPYPVLIRNTRGLITYVNPAFTQTFGWTLEELKGTQGRQYIPAHLQSELAKKIKALPPNKTVLKLTTRRLTKTGQVLDVIVRVGIDRDEDLKPAGMVMVFRDITKEKRTDRNQSAINRISQALPQYPELPGCWNISAMRSRNCWEPRAPMSCFWMKKGKNFLFWAWPMMTPPPGNGSGKPGFQWMNCCPVRSFKAANR